MNKKLLLSIGTLGAVVAPVAAVVACDSNGESSKHEPGRKDVTDVPGMELVPRMAIGDLEGRVLVDKIISISKTKFLLKIGSDWKYTFPGNDQETTLKDGDVITFELKGHQVDIVLNGKLLVSSQDTVYINNLKTTAFDLINLVANTAG